MFHKSQFILELSAKRSLSHICIFAPQSSREGALITILTKHTNLFFIGFLLRWLCRTLVSCILLFFDWFGLQCKWVWSLTRLLWEISLEENWGLSLIWAELSWGLIGTKHWIPNQVGLQCIVCNHQPSERSVGQDGEVCGGQVSPAPMIHHSDGGEDAAPLLV